MKHALAVAVAVAALGALGALTACGGAPKHAATSPAEPAVESVSPPPTGAGPSEELEGVGSPAPGGAEAPAKNSDEAQKSSVAPTIEKAPARKTPAKKAPPAPKRDDGNSADPCEGGE